MWGAREGDICQKISYFSVLYHTAYLSCKFRNEGTILGIFHHLTNIHIDFLWTHHFDKKKSLPFFCLVYLKQLAVGHIYKTIFNFIRIFIDIKLYSLIFCRCHIFSINIPQSLIWSHQWWLAAWICAKEPARIQPLSKLDWQRPNAMHIKYFEAWLWSMFLQILKQLIQQKVIHIGIISISKQKNK